MDRRMGGGEVISAGGQEVANRPQNGITAALSWKDLSVVVKNTKKVLHELSGVAEPGRLLAIMGPSGSGKTSLLDTLGGRQSKDAIVTGQILLNGRKAKLSYGSAAYLAQEVLILGTLTVYETVYFSAKLRFPDSMSEEETVRIVKATIADVGLSRSIDTPIGNWQRRGISGGEKRRLNIAIELLTRPRLLFLDEPTSGLDSASAYEVVSTLKALAHDGCTVISSIHQPSSEVFDLFDDLCLLSAGQQIYFGTLSRALEFFAKAGFPCPPLRNPSDHYLFSINSDFDSVHILNSLRRSTVTNIEEEDLEKATGSTLNDSRKILRASDNVKSLTQSFAGSTEKQDLDMKIHAMSKLEGEVLDVKGSQASFLRQSCVLTRRSFLNMSRDAGYYWLRLVTYNILAIALGTIFYKVGYSYNAIQARAACVFFGVAFFTFMSVGGFPSFIEDMKVFGMERLNGHYGVGAFVIGNTVSSVPFLFLISLTSSAVIYFMVDLHSGAQYFIYFTLTTFACLLVVESLMMAVASVVPNFLMGIVLGSGIQGLLMLVSGFFRLPDDLPKPIWRYPMSYISFHYYGLQGFLDNDFKGLTFENLNPADNRLTGSYVLRHNYQIDLDRSKWWNLAILFFMAVGYRFVFYALIRLSENFFPVVLAFVNKKKVSVSTSILKRSASLSSASAADLHNIPNL